jgi:hypothetical protein
MKSVTRVLLVVLAIFCASSLFADYLDISRATSLRSEPSRNATSVQQLPEATVLELLDDGQQTNGYYHARLSSTEQSGWVYRTLVRRQRHTLLSATLDEGSM